MTVAFPGPACRRHPAAVATLYQSGFGLDHPVPRRGADTVDESSPSAPDWDVPHPVLFNVWKHHAEALRRRVRDAAAAGEAGLALLPDKLLVVGTELMDLYTGPLTPVEIGQQVLAQLRAENRLEREAFGAWVEENGGYRLLTFAADESVWVLRFADKDERYVHVHPGRWTPHTRRVRANVVKTAVMVLADAALHGGDPLDVKRINHVRKKYLGLAPVRELTPEQGLDGVFALLREG